MTIWNSRFNISKQYFLEFWNSGILNLASHMLYCLKTMGFKIQDFKTICFYLGILNLEYYLFIYIYMGFKIPDFKIILFWES